MCQAGGYPVAEYYYQGYGGFDYSQGGGYPAPAGYAYENYGSPNGTSDGSAPYDEGENKQ